MHFILCYIIQISCNTGLVHRLKSVVTKTESLKKKEKKLKIIMKSFSCLILCCFYSTQIAKNRFEELQRRFKPKL